MAGGRNGIKHFRKNKGLGEEEEEEEGPVATFHNNKDVSESGVGAAAPSPRSHLSPRSPKTNPSGELIGSR